MNGAFHGLLFLVVFGGPVALLWSVYREEWRD